VRKAIILLAMLMVGCANRPETIHASFVSHERFMDLSCMQLVTKMSATRSDLDKFSKMQDSKATGDAWGVFLLGVPFSKLSGDHEGDVARLKGEVEAIETAQIKNRCTDGGGGRAMEARAPATTQQTSAAQPAAAMPTPYVSQLTNNTATQPVAVGADTLQAENYARSQSCNTAPRAALVAKGAGFETFSVGCANGDSIMVRCEFGNCRTLR
jgi:hypothetical protein